MVEAEPAFLGGRVSSQTAATAMITEAAALAIASLRLFRGPIVRITRPLALGEFGRGRMPGHEFAVAAYVVLLFPVRDPACEEAHGLEGFDHAVGSQVLVYLLW